MINNNNNNNNFNFNMNDAGFDKYASDSKGPYTVLTGFASIDLDDIESSPALSELLRRKPQDEFGSRRNVMMGNKFEQRRQTSGLLTAQIHYPRELLADKSKKLPVLVLARPLQVANEIVASFFTLEFFYDQLQFFASHGFITITTTEHSSTDWNYEAEIKIGERSMQLLRYIEAMNTRPGSWLFQRYNQFAGNRFAGVLHHITSHHIHFHIKIVPVTITIIIIIVITLHHITFT